MSVIAETNYGDYEGYEKNGTVIFKGIKYAHAPRFLPPAKIEKHDGLYKADKFGQVSYQPTEAMGGLLSGPDPDVAEECLFLNIHTMDLNNKARPVMVWIHGGGFTGGSGSTPWYNGTKFVVNSDVVIVTVNYRLGALGFLNLSEFLDDRYQSSGLTGILDQITALKWIHENIAAFGGDPNNVTIFGESAGAMSIGTLLAIPEARRYFRKAILQSGATRNCLTQQESKTVTEAYLNVLKFDSAEQLLDCDPNNLLKKQTEVSAELLRNKSLDPIHVAKTVALPFQPSLDGIYLTKMPSAAIKNGDAKDIPLIVGTNSDEWNLFALMEKAPKTFEEIEFRAKQFNKPNLVSNYRNVHGSLNATELWNTIMTDIVFRNIAVGLLNDQTEHQPNCYQYLFSWKSTAFDGFLGACHALEIPFVFDNLHVAGAKFVTGENPPEELARLMNRLWSNFAHFGDPNSSTWELSWPKYSATDPKLLNFNIDVTVEKTAPVVRG